MGSNKVLSEAEIQEIEKQYDEIIRVCPRCQSDENKALIRKAFDLACEAHKEMRRKSGEPYIWHPIEVAKIVAEEIGLGTKSVICALLHDVVEDTDYTIEDMEQQFGPKIASIIDGLTKISHVFDKESSLQAENFRKMLLTLSDDVRVILIKLADRLHNMRTLESMPAYKQIKIAGETLFLYAPLAHRLGLYTVKTELEDLSFKYEQEAVYNDILQKLKETENKRVEYINKFSQPIIDKLNEANIDYTITGRPKSVYSIWKKMQNKNVPFEEVYDIFAIRVVFNPINSNPEKTQCWMIYSLVTDIFSPKPDRLRDWVSTPKANGYEALHTTVMGPEGKWVEVQIRSKRMDEIAEKGYAAHWKYKGDGADEGELDKWIKKIRELLTNKESSALEFLDEFKMNLFSSEIYVFTPKGQIKRLPKGATILDFAFDIHSAIGNRAVGAKVNHKLVGLSYQLQSGDQVEIITSEKQTPQKEWLNIVTTAKAKSALKTSFKAERRESIEKGQMIFIDKLAELNRKPAAPIYRKLFGAYGITTKSELYIQIGMGTITADDIKKIVLKRSQSKFVRYWQLRVSKTTFRFGKRISPKKDAEQKINKKIPLILAENINEDQYIIAKCCSPIPGDDVMGYITPNNSVIVHKKTCPKAIEIMANYGDKIVTAEWTKHKLMASLARIQLKGIDRMGLVNNVTKGISEDLAVNMRAVSFESNDGIFFGFIELYIHDTDDLNNLIKNLKKIKGVDSVVRIEMND
ncbi:MAG: GTP pyrophosphokinase [Bacteroidetes bacterium RIFOXYA2_FULL_33_7]|nr:MAG: GTP pyrophosphokinase [Bacteroidetes bacterium RIFOXYA2_FULL_33_7]